MSKLYPVSGARTKKLLAQAAKTNRERDEIERSYGHAAPPDCNLDVLLRTVLSALDAGIQGKDWPCVAEAMEMLIQAEAKLRQDSIEEEATRRAVDLFGTSERDLIDAAWIRRRSPEIAAKVWSGEMTLDQAMKVIQEQRNTKRGDSDGHTSNRD